jgi:DNA-binding CsgD family transcriptional regulator
VIALLALSHTPVEHRLYVAMLAETAGAALGRVFSLRRLMEITGLHSESTIRRARSGLIAKLSMDCRPVADGEGASEAQVGSYCYLVYRPEEIFERRRRAGLEPYPKEYRRQADQSGFTVAIERVAEQHDLSRREAQVALCCAEGMTNSEIGERLFITEQTVKFHLRHVFIKFGVRRRGELISQLLRQKSEAVGANSMAKEAGGLTG